MQNQYNFCSYLSQCHELWEQADLYVVKKVICEGERTEIEYPGVTSENTYNINIPICQESNFSLIKAQNRN